MLRRSLREQIQSVVYRSRSAARPRRRGRLLEGERVFVFDGDDPFEGLPKKVSFDDVDRFYREYRKTVASGKPGKVGGRDTVQLPLTRMPDGTIKWIELGWQRAILYQIEVAVKSRPEGPFDVIATYKDKRNGFVRTHMF